MIQLPIQMCEEIWFMATCTQKDKTKSHCSVCDTICVVPKEFAIKYGGMVPGNKSYFNIHNKILCRVCVTSEDYNQ